MATSEKNREARVAKQNLHVSLIKLKLPYPVQLSVMVSNSVLLQKFDRRRVYQFL